MDKSLIKQSKFISLLLRHKPEILGLSLDENGWVSVDELLEAAMIAKKTLNKELLIKIVETNDKQRFSFSEDGKKIRANQGHSIVVHLDLEPVIPPDILYHGTAIRFLDSILRHGLLPGNRNHVHLSPDEETAICVGKRHGKSTALKIEAKQMNDAGFLFYLSKNGVWLTEKVPGKFIHSPYAENP